MLGPQEGGAARAGVDEGELLLVPVDDAACAAGALAAVGGHGRHVCEGAGDEAAVIPVCEVSGGEGDGGVGAHGPGDDRAVRPVVEPGESVALVAPLLCAKGVGEPLPGGHADDQAAVEAVCPGAEVPRGAEVGAEAGVGVAQYPEVSVRLVPVSDGAGAVGREGGVDCGAGYEGETEGGVGGAVGEGGGRVGGGELEVVGQAGRGDAGGRARDARFHVDGAEGAGEVPGEGLSGFALVETVADGLVGDARGAGL